MPKKTKKEITPGPEPMPSLIYNEGTIKKTDEEILKAVVKDLEPRRRMKGYDPEASRLMWLGVAGVAMIIIILWGWALSVQFSLINWNKSPDKKLVEQTQKSWQSAFDSGADGVEELKNQIKSDLVKILSPVSSTMVVATTSSASTSSAKVISTTTPKSPSTTKRNNLK